MRCGGEWTAGARDGVVKGRRPLVRWGRDREVGVARVQWEWGVGSGETAVWEWGVGSG